MSPLHSSDTNRSVGAKPQAGFTNDALALRNDCWGRAIETFGTAYIFQDRIRTPRRNLRVITFLGIAIPALVGGIILSFGTDPTMLKPLLWAAGILGTVQLALSVWALVARWDDEVAYGFESSADNFRLSSQYERLGKTGPADIALRFEVLEAANQARINSDVRVNLTDRQKRMGLRAGLRQFRRECVSCGHVPESMTSTPCAICGNF